MTRSNQIGLAFGKIRGIFKAALKKYYYILLIIFYPLKKELAASPLLIRGYVLPQKILNVNKARNVPWPVHFTSMVRGIDKITIGHNTTPGYMPGCYIQSLNGIRFGNNVLVGPGVKIISANHDPEDLKNHKPGKPITIGNNVWIGANAIILPEVTIGNNVIIGGGSVVVHDIGDNSIAVGNPAKVIKNAR